jgi:hypothetical protein
MRDSALQSFVDRMRDQTTCEYVVLAYVMDPAHEALQPVAVAARELGSDDARLMLHIPTDFPTVVSVRHLDYMNILIEDWREIPNDRLGDLFRELRELSSGPLRAQSYGFCSIGELPRLVKEVLGANEQLKVDG